MFAFVAIVPEVTNLYISFICCGKPVRLHLSQQYKGRSSGRDKARYAVRRLTAYRTIEYLIQRYKFETAFPGRSLNIIGKAAF